MIDPRTHRIAPHQPSIVGFQQFGRCLNIRHPRIEPEIIRVWIEDDGHMRSWTAGATCSKLGFKWRNFGDAWAERKPIPCTSDENLFTVLRKGGMSIQSDTFLKSKRRCRMKPRSPHLYAGCVCVFLTFVLAVLVTLTGVAHAQINLEKL